ncbi:hypothetical protein SAMN05421547_101572 [Delftia lacustris]|uniref:Uncharacterized protein n=1 Tax=Delftia lacustris TaxID=558537 RepID=A0A1H3FA63_9BURK|nr:hypothetical protein SAMN05421547_101572 [Delftia lacustris]
MKIIFNILQGSAGKFQPGHATIDNLHSRQYSVSGETIKP